MRALSLLLLGMGLVAALVARAEPRSLVEGSFAPSKAPPLLTPDAPLETVRLPETRSPFDTPKPKVTPRGEVVFVERRIALSEGDVPLKEYYLNVGKMDDVQVGDVFHVFRELPVVDVRVGEPLEFIPVKIGEIQITTTGESTSVGQMLGMLDPRSLPKLDYAVIMVGDRVKRKLGLPFASNS